MDIHNYRYAWDAPAFAREVLDFHPDPIQHQLLAASPFRCILNCSRQWGKSTITAVKALHQAIFFPDSLVLILSPSERQSAEFINKVSELSLAAGYKPKGDGRNTISLRFPNASRIIGLPSKEATVRGFSAVALLLIDEASRVPDQLYRTVRPMIAVSGGALWLISTPAGRRGFFYETWISNDAEWTRVSVPATLCPRIPESFLESERRFHGDRIFAQEYLCEFKDQDGQIISNEDIERALSTDIKPLCIPAQPLVTPLPVMKTQAANVAPSPLPDRELHRRLYIGVDFGQSHDHSAIAILEKTSFFTGPVSHVDYRRTYQERFAVRHLERFLLGTPYCAVIDRIGQIVRRMGPRPHVELAVDATGAGRPLVELIRKLKLPCPFYPVNITSGDSESFKDPFYNVPKPHLLTALVLQFETGLFKIAAGMELAAPLLQEVAGLRIKVSQSGNDIFSHDAAEHDDLVFALALANWQATKDRWAEPNSQHPLVF